MTFKKFITPTFWTLLLAVGLYILFRVISIILVFALMYFGDGNDPSRFFIILPFFYLFSAGTALGQQLVTTLVSSHILNLRENADVTAFSAFFGILFQIVYIYLLSCIVVALTTKKSGKKKVVYHYATPYTQE